MIRSADVALASGSCVAMLLALYGAFVFAPTERVMGDVQRIFYVHLPLAWIGDFAAKMQAIFGADPFPYGIEPNRPTLEAFLQYAREQGLCARALAPEDLFVPEVREAYKI